jgi:glycosyltransferase involved in cell wall biosynthesis
MNVVFYGYVFEPTGYGAASRAYVHALHQAGLNLSVVSLGKRQLIRDSLVESLLYREISEPEVHICHADPSLLPFLKHHSDRLIALTSWETDRVPSEWIGIFDKVLEVWVPCTHNVEIFERHIKSPIFCVPHPLMPDSPHLKSSFSINDELGLKRDDYVFYSIFTWQERKNPVGIMNAFLKAFPNEPDVSLVLKTRWTLTPERVALGQLAHQVQRSISTCTASSNLNEMRDEKVSWNRTSSLRIIDEVAKIDRRIKIVGGDWSDEWLTMLAERANCYVSLHRGEGWCYPLFDAASRGKPVIATNYSGPLDYLTSEFHNLVDYHLTPVAQKYMNFDSEMLWAQPDLSHASALMRYVYESPEEASAQAKKGVAFLQQKYSLERIGKTVVDRLHTIIADQHHLTRTARA